MTSTGGQVVPFFLEKVMYKVHLSLHELCLLIGAVEYEAEEYFPKDSEGQKERKKLQEKLEKFLD